MNSIKSKLIDIVIIGVVLFGAALCVIMATQMIEDMSKDDVSIRVSAEGLNSLENNKVIQVDNVINSVTKLDEKPYTLIHETFKVVAYDGEYYEAVNVKGYKGKERLYFTKYDVKGNENVIIGNTITSVHLDDSEEEDLFLFVYKNEESKINIYD